MPAHLIAQDGPNRGFILDFAEGAEWTVGRDPDTCDFSIEDSTVSRKHAKFSKTDEGIYVKNLSRVNPVLVNEEEISEKRLLKEGDRVQIGNTTFLFSEEELPNLDTKPARKEKKKKKSGYDDIFGDIEPQEESEESSLEEKPSIPREPEEIPTHIPPPPPKPEMTAYDTIFEDTGTDEEIPFNLLPEAPLVLKVIAGPNAGAEIGIEKGRVYTIGKDPNTCDIVFQDLSVSRNHARLTVSQDGTIDIEDLNSKNGTAINGSVIADRTTVTPQDLVALGTTIFLIIDREAPQETIYSPVASSSFETAKEEPVAEVIPEEKPEEEFDWKKEPIPTRYLVIGGSAAAVFLIMFLSFFSLFKSGHIEVASKEPVSEIKEALAKFSDVQFSYNPGSGKLFLVGHVLTPVDYQEMKYRLSQIGFITSVEDNVVIDEGVWKMMNDIISDNPAWRGVSIHSPTAGKFVVNGFIPNGAESAKLSDYLTVNFPYLDRLENQVVVEEALTAQLQAMIGEQNLGAVTFQLSNGNVILTGRYNENRASQYESLVKTINGLKGVTSVKNFAIASHPNQAGIDLTQQYEVTGTSTYDGQGYSVVMNGKIYTLGDFVDGMKLTQIDPNTILLEKDGLKYKIDYTR